MSSQTREFESWASKLLELETDKVETNPETCFQEINQIIDHVNAFNYDQPFLNFILGEAILNHCVQLIPLTEAHLITKFCSLINHFLRKQHILISKGTAENLCSFILQALQACSQWLYSDLLLTLSTLLFLNATAVQQHWEQLLGDDGILLKFANVTNNKFTIETRYYAVKCIEWLTVKETNTSYISAEMVQRCFIVLINNLMYDLTVQEEEIINNKLRCSCCVSFQNLVLESKALVLKMTGEVLAVLKAHMFYGLPNQSQLPTAKCLYPSPLSQSYFSVSKSNSLSPSTKNSTHNSRSKKRRSSSKKIVSNESRGHSNSTNFVEDKFDDKSPSQRFHRTFMPMKVSSSESEYSDSEGSNLARLRASQTRVRHCALAALSSVVKVLDRKVMFGYWPSFLPDASSSYGNLTSCFLKDPSPKVRCGALMVLSCLLDGSSSFLSLADERDKSKMAFTTLSATVTSIVRELHRTLILALVAETSTLVLTQIIKCITLLVQNVSIAKLSEGFLIKLAKQLKSYLFHKESNVKVAALTSFGAILNAQQGSPEGLEILQWPIQNVDHCKNDEKQTCWLIEICFEYITERNPVVPLPVRLESLQLLSIIIKDYFIISRSYLNTMKLAIEAGLVNKELSIKLHSSKLLEELGRTMSQLLESKTELKLNLTINEVVLFWSNLLDTSLPNILQAPMNDVNYQILVVHGCNCLSTIGSEAFSKLQMNQQIFCQTVLIGLASSENKNVKAAAIRGLGVLIQFSCLQADGSFLLDILEKIVCAMEDASLEVRLKAAWALGNITDVLILQDNSLEEGLLNYQLNDKLLKQLLMASIKGSKDNDRITSNGVRALGNLLRILKQNHLEDTNFNDIVGQSVETLMKCSSSSSSMKVRWNSCYAIGNFLKNNNLSFEAMIWKHDLFQLLCDLAKNCRNYKVRISAVSALGIPKCRAHYGSNEDLLIIWQSLIEGLVNIQSSMNFVEYQHGDHLADQICETLCHLLSLLEVKDLESISNTLPESTTECLKYYFERYSTKEGTHKSLDTIQIALVSAKDNIEKYKENTDDIIIQVCNKINIIIGE